jgi:malate dehydrogenase (oxaloacetate-decarboxylating)(NADP+)
MSSVPHPREISVRPTKGLTNQRDLALAFSPGLAVSDDKLGHATTRLLEEA